MKFIDLDLIWKSISFHPKKNWTTEKVKLISFFYVWKEKPEGLIGLIAMRFPFIAILLIPFVSIIYQIVAIHSMPLWYIKPIKNNSHQLPFFLSFHSFTLFQAGFFVLHRFVLFILLLPLLLISHSQFVRFFMCRCLTLAYSQTNEKYKLIRSYKAQGKKEWKRKGKMERKLRQALERKA